MFQALDTMISLGVIFLILSMVNKYLISIVKRILKIKAKVITKELETFIGEKTSKYLISYLKNRAKHLNFLDEKKRLRKLNKKQLETVVAELEKFMKSENAKEFKEVFGIDIDPKKITERIRKDIDEVKEHLNNLKGKVETMYDNTMEKISEVCETKIRYHALYFGIALAFFVNADFFGLYNSLSKSPTIQAQLVAQSDNIRTRMDDISKQIEESEGEKIKDKKEVVDEINNIKTILGGIETAGLELGWTEDKLYEVFQGWWHSIYKFIGLIISGLLISFGAPFWHDFIGTFTGLRKTLRAKKEEKEGNVR